LKPAKAKGHPPCPEPDAPPPGHIKGDGKDRPCGKGKGNDGNSGKGKGGDAGGGFVLLLPIAARAAWELRPLRLRGRVRPR
jgi:hypothetical protein